MIPWQGKSRLELLWECRAVSLAVLRILAGKGTDTSVLATANTQRKGAVFARAFLVVVAGGVLKSAHGQGQAQESY